VIERPPPINRIPQPLLGYFGIKNGGRYPQTLSETLAPTIDLRYQYDAAGYEWEEQTDNAPAVGRVLTLTCDEGEMILVHFYGMVFKSGVGDAMRASICHGRQTPAVAVPLLTHFNLGASNWSNSWYYGPHLIVPGEFFGYDASLVTNASGTLTVVTTAKFTRYLL